MRRDLIKGADKGGAFALESETDEGLLPFGFEARGGGARGNENWGCPSLHLIHLWVY